MDIWSLGCILAELIAFTNVYVKNNRYLYPKRCIYKGSACYLLEKEYVNPDNNDEISDNDMIVKIFQKSSQIEPAQDFSFITEKRIKDINDQIFSEKKSDPQKIKKIEVEEELRCR